MKLSYNRCTIDDFIRLLSLCKCKDSEIKRSIVNGIEFYFPETTGQCDMDSFPLISRDPNAVCSPVICCASGNNYVLLKTFGEHFVLDQHTSITAFIIHLSEIYNNVRILDAKFGDDSTIWLVVFNGYSSN